MFMFCACALDHVELEKIYNTKEYHIPFVHTIDLCS